MFLLLDNGALIAHLQERGVLRSPKIREALEMFPRQHFVPADWQDEAYFDHALPIGHGQTISQPLVVVFMLEELDAQEGDNVLEIGAGSGWQAALLSHLVGTGNPPRTPHLGHLPKGEGSVGQVWAYEINPIVAAFGKANLKRFKLNNVHYLVGDATQEATEHAPYDRIIAGAAFTEIPKDLVKLLKIGGRLVAPTQQGDVGDIRVIVRESAETYRREKPYPNFVFVPITHK